MVSFLCVLLTWGCSSGHQPPGTVATTNNPPSCENRARFGAPANSLYVLPYPVGESSEVLQAYCTFGSHQTQLAYDFIRPFGSDVTAVRDGEIMQAVSHHPDFTRDNVHNHLLIVHDDGTTAFYAHLQQNSIVVAEGDFVFAGQLLGLNGSSGTPTACDTFILDPPRDQCAILHFGVYASCPPEDHNDLAINFRNADSMLDVRLGLAAGQTYTALSY